MLYYLNGVEYTDRVYDVNDGYILGNQIPLYYFEGYLYTELELYVPMIIVTVIHWMFIVFFITIHIIDMHESTFKRNFDKYVKKTGRVVKVVINKFITTGRGGDSHPYYLVCDVYYEGEKLTLKSKLFENYIKVEEYDILDAYFKNKKKYYIDLESYRKDIFY